jgi:GNAT superfamily N-acetyltransferase
MSLYGQYILEREGRHILETDQGFITYHLFDNGECYIVDVYVVPEARKSGLSMKMKADVETLAKTKGCHTLIGSVCTDTNDSVRNLNILLSDGWRVHKMTGNMLFLNKKILGEL